MNLLSNWIRKALTRRQIKHARRPRKIEYVEIPPSERLVYAVQFCLISLAALTAIEIAHIIALKSFNQTVFSAISGLIGTLVGVFLAK
ncbi:hypothetical protein DRO54_06450 [Candidatus Bathyarchaeota archaeon]|nr:MAG: hypothetical protein DRO54_06450 [Candidatus Bathyarchaeota archaeon]